MILVVLNPVCQLQECHFKNQRDCFSDFKDQRDCFSSLNYCWGVTPSVTFRHWKSPPWKIIYIKVCCFEVWKQSSLWSLKWHSCSWPVQEAQSHLNKRIMYLGPCLSRHSQSFKDIVIKKFPVQNFSTQTILRLPGLKPASWTMP